MADSHGGSAVLLAPEAELYIQELRASSIKDIGSPKWRSQHEYLEKLNMQAILSASAQEDEYIKEALITQEKIPVLIHNLIAIEIWKTKIFPELIEMGYNPSSTLPVYFVMFHEVTLVSLLETILYHKESCEAAEDSIMDLADYCHRKITYLVARQEEAFHEDELEDIGKKTDMYSSVEELKKQEKTLAFNVSVKAVSILRYIIDHANNLPISVLTRILNTQDMPVVLVQLIENPPWVRRNSEGKLIKYFDNKWKVVPDQERFQLTKHEGQVWLAIFQLLMTEECQRKYELSSYRKSQILKLRGFLNEVLLDQIPSLLDLQRYLEHLAIMEPPSIRSEILLEQVPEIRENLIKQNSGKWKKIAQHQLQAYFSPSEAELKKQAQILAQTYNMDVLEGLVNEPPKCALCGMPATKRCSRCKNEWYCRRECQVKHWAKHKQVCSLLAEEKS